MTSAINNTRLFCWYPCELWYAVVTVPNPKPIVRMWLVGSVPVLVASRWNTFIVKQNKVECLICKLQNEDKVKS